ncbi:MAG: FAD-dependent oxidoreductase [Ignavibacteriaceae bacterium]|nr:FAD-dependent oxidoreductase [Ignavibacteriaceae bacterium]
MDIYNYQLLVIGGGCGGASAAIQAARLGIKTLLVEETPWLGGMVTAAGVSAFDGNKYAVGGGIFAELRSMIEDYYGGADKTFTGWISLTCFEPKKGAEFLHTIASKEKSLDIWFESSLVKPLLDGNRITGAEVKRKDGTVVQVNAAITIEATEFGDLLKLANIPYRLGRDAKSDTGEADACHKWDGEVQDVTFCAILKKYDGTAPVIAPSADYDPERFINSTDVHCDTTDEKILGHKLHSFESFITYAALPNDKYLLNWPFRSNDYPTTIDLYENLPNRKWHYEQAKRLTLDFIHYIQTRLGHPEWGLATDEFPTDDALPFIPYVRESRRIKGLRLMKEEDVIPVSGSHRPPLQKDSIAVGDYFLDHHHSKFFIGPEDQRISENYPDNAPFQIPLGTLIPEGYEGIIASEKSISVTHIVNGCTRLQPCVMQTGQAAGVLAALSIKKNCSASGVATEEVQDILLDAGASLFPYKDLFPSNLHFKAIQKLALKGIFIDEEDHYFHPEKIVTADEIPAWFKHFGLIDFVNVHGLEGMTRDEAFALIAETISKK